MPFFKPSLEEGDVSLLTFSESTLELLHCIVKQNAKIVEMIDNNTDLIISGNVEAE